MGIRVQFYQGARDGLESILINTFLRFFSEAFIYKDSSQLPSWLFWRAIAVKAVHTWCRSEPELFFRTRRGEDLS